MCVHGILILLGEMFWQTKIPRTTDTSFIENPVSQKQPPKFTTPDPKTSHGCSTGQPLARGSRGGRAERGSGQGRERPSGLIRPRVRGVR